MKVRPLLPAALAALVALTAACTADPGASSAPPTTPPPASVPPSETPTATPEPTEAPSAPPTLAYEPATVPPTELNSATLTIVPGGEGLVAIGFDGAFGSLLWTSADGGRTWTDITPADFASIGIASVVEYDGMLVGVGRGNTIDVDAEQAAVYLSEDGTSWRKVETGEQLVGQMIDVVATDDGLFAVGGVPGADSAGVWHSTDAETWTRVGGDIDHAFLWSIAEGGAGLVAVGWRRNPEPDLAVWTSADAGQTWKLAPDPEASAGYEATDVAALPDGTLAMVGSAFDGSGGRIWTSTDGATWTVALDDMGGGYARTLTVTDAGLVAIGGGDDMHGRAWFAADGVAWTPLGEPLEGTFFTAAVPTADGLLVTGATQAGTMETGIEARAGIWIGSFGD